MMNKSTADPSGNYADFLASTVESNKDAFTEDELNTLTADIETIRKIEEQIAEIEKKDTTSESADANDNSGSTSPFRNFSGQDYDGNTVDESLFSGNAVTVINFWFTGCKPCVAELSKLNELNDAIKSMGGEVVGINTETFDGNETAIKEAAAVLESQGAKYRNLPSTHLPMQENTLPILWHFLQPYSLTETVILSEIRCLEELIIRTTMIL